MEDRVTGQTQLAQHFPDRAHHFGHPLRPDHYQRDRKNQYYFKRVQASMTVRSMRCSIDLTSIRWGKFRAISPCQLIIIRVRRVNIEIQSFNDA